MNTRPGTASVSFIIPVRNDAARLEQCLRSILMNTYGGARIEIVVVDNASTDGSADVARRAGARVVPVENAGVAELRNIGALHATGDILAFVDADHEIVATWVAAAVHTLRAQDVAAAGALCHAPIEGTWVQRAYGALRGIPRGVHDVEWLGSGNMAVRRTVFNSARGFDTSLTTCEDVDLCNRMRSSGYRIVSNAQMKNVHYGDPGTLLDLFKGELWRGQDNLRVSFRTRLSWRGLPSVLLPIVDLLMIAAAVLGLIALAGGSSLGGLVSGGAAATVAAGATLRVLRMVVRDRRMRPSGFLQAWAVAFIYDIGRALALVTRAPHRAARAQTVTAQ